MKQSPTLKSLNFHNNKQMISTILNQQIFEMSSLQSSMSSSDLNFSTFRSSDFISFLQHSRNNSPDRQYIHEENQVKVKGGKIRYLWFRNDGRIIRKVLDHGRYSKIIANTHTHTHAYMNRCDKLGQIRKINFRVNKEIVNKILCK